jgi:hypothetical protein
VTAAGGGRATWNDEGYYFAEAGEFVWVDMCKKIAAEVKKQGYIQDDSLQVLTVEEGDKATPNGGKKWYVPCDCIWRKSNNRCRGFNSRARAIRANKLFGWKPKGEDIIPLLPKLVEEEAKKLGVYKTHAQKAAGDA